MLNLSVRKAFTFGSSKEGGPAATPPADNRRNTLGGPFSTAGGGQPSGPSGRRYSLSFTMAVRNILNHNNPGPIVGNIASPLFGEANQPYGVGVLGGTGFSESANNRRLEFQTRFTF
jgi:hypothetical protein